MAKAHPVYESFWGDPDVRLLSPDLKLIALFLMTWSSGGIGASGIYPLVVPADISFHTGIDDGVCAEAIRKRRIKNVVYHEETSTVFVKNRLRYRMSGAKWLLCKSILGDIKLTRSARPLWLLWKELYPEYVEMDEGISAALMELGLEQSTKVASALIPGRLPPDIEGKREVNLDNELATRLERYRDELDADDFGFVEQVFKFLATDPKSSGLISNFRRVRILEQLEKEAVLQVARACYLFIEAGGCDPSSTKGFAYLRGVVNGTAADWYGDYIAEKGRMNPD